MAAPNSATPARILLERSLKEMMTKTCMAEQRTKLLGTLLRMNLLPRDVRSFMRKQLKQQRVRKPGKGARHNHNKCKSGKQRLTEKFTDSRLEEINFRKERDSLRKKLEESVPVSTFPKIMRKLKSEVDLIRSGLKAENKKKVEGYKEERDLEDLAELSSLKEEMGEFGQLKIFRGISIQPEERKPPVLSKEVSLNKYELEVLSKNPKYAVRAMMSKEKFMVEFEKGICKKLYGDIGKEVSNGKTIEEEPENDEDVRVLAAAEWQARKSELVYDFEQKDLDFARQKATNMKGNKRITLPKASDIQMEALIEVRRKRASKLYDMCVKKLGEGCERGQDNLTPGERRGLKSLKKRVTDGEIIVCQTDKSGRFCVLTRDQYLEAGQAHVVNDRKIDQKEHEEVQRALNGNMRWWSVIWDLGSNWGQESRCLSNLLNHGLGTCPMTLLVKDHKTWDIIPKTRSVMGGNEGGNSGISEFVSLVLEPIAREQDGNMEINATNGLLADITDYNTELDIELGERMEPSSPEEDQPGILEEVPENSTVVSSLVEGQIDGTQFSNLQEGNPPPSLEEKLGDGIQIPTPQEDLKVHPRATPVGAGSSLEEGITAPGQKDIRQFLVDGKGEKLQFREESFVEPNAKDEPFDKMRMIRNKMAEARRLADKHENAVRAKNEKEPMKDWEGERILYARDVINSMVQDEQEVVVIGADVVALYPNLTDLEVANICYEAVMKSKVKIKNINYRKGLLYIAINMNKTDQRSSPLWRILPRRTSGGGVRPGVTSDPEKEDHWYFPKVELTELEKRMVVATIVKIGVLVMMNTHVYSWNGDTFLQKAGGPIGLRSTCAVARVVMNEWDSRWRMLCANNNIRIGKNNRYMDDIRAFLKALRMGWRWMDGRLCYTESWLEEDKKEGLSASRRSANILVGMMNEVFPFLSFTVELGEDFLDGKLPSLDCKVWVKDGWKILFEFFEKTMASNLMVEAGSALSKEVKQSTLAEEISRRLRNTSLELDLPTRLEILEKACVKMKTSGHTDIFIRQAVEQGIKTFAEKVRRSRLDVRDGGYQPLYPKAGWRRDEKAKEKALKRGNWFKGKDESKTWDNIPKAAGRVKKRKPFLKAGSKAKLKNAATVIFVPSTKGSLLLKSLREDEERMSELTGFKIKYQEAGGNVLNNAFDKNLGRGQHCGRDNCPPCQTSEKKGICKTKGIVYESKCKLCNPSSQQEDQHGDAQPPGGKPTSRVGIYIGESSRSLHERALEHVKDAESFCPKSHIVKHWMTAHPELDSPPTMEFGVTAIYRDCLSRQIGEALRIHNTTDEILNSKSEYMANSVRRLTVEEDAWERRERSRREQEDEELNKRMVEEFMRAKRTGHAHLDEAQELPEIPTPSTATTPTQEPPEISQNTAKQNLHSQNLVNQSEVTVNTVTESEYLGSGGVGACKTLEVSPDIKDDTERYCPGSLIDTPGNTQRVTLGQSNGSPVRVQVEHPWLKTVYKKEVDWGEGADEQQKAVAEYATDEDEFMQQEQDPPVLTFAFTQKAAPTGNQVLQSSKSRKHKKGGKGGYHLAYFSLWWNRMQREAGKEEESRRKEDERDQLLERWTAWEYRSKESTQQTEVISERPLMTISEQSMDVTTLCLGRGGTRITGETTNGICGVGEVPVDNIFHGTQNTSTSSENVKFIFEQHQLSLYFEDWKPA